MKYRIVRNGDRYRVQQRRFLFWRFARVYPVNRPWFTRGDIFTADSFVEAEKLMRLDALEYQKWEVLREYGAWETLEDLYQVNRAKQKAVTP